MRGVGEEERLDFVIGSAHQWLWRTQVVEAALAEHPGPKHVLRYEELLREPEHHVAELFEWLGVPLDPGEVVALVERFDFERLPDRGPTSTYGSRSPAPGARTYVRRRAPPWSGSSARS